MPGINPGPLVSRTNRASRHTRSALPHLWRMRYKRAIYVRSRHKPLYVVETDSRGNEELSPPGKKWVIGGAVRSKAVVGLREAAATSKGVYLR